MPWEPAASQDFPGHLHLAYNDLDGTQYNTFLVQSTDGAQTWTQPVAVRHRQSSEPGHLTAARSLVREVLQRPVRELGRRTHLVAPRDAAASRGAGTYPAVQLRYRLVGRQGPPSSCMSAPTVGTAQ